MASSIHDDFLWRKTLVYGTISMLWIKKVVLSMYMLQKKSRGNNSLSVANTVKARFSRLLVLPESSPERPHFRSTSSLTLPGHA